MSIWTTIVLGVALGAGLGGLFFGGLWWTVRRVGRRANPGAWLLVSAGLRLGLAVGGFYLAARLGGAALVGAMVAFLAVRTVAIRSIRPDRQPDASPAEG